MYKIPPGMLTFLNSFGFTTITTFLLTGKAVENSYW